jgi:hypothetical protein
LPSAQTRRRANIAAISMLRVPAAALYFTNAARAAAVGGPKRQRSPLPICPLPLYFRFDGPMISLISMKRVPIKCAAAGQVAADLQYSAARRRSCLLEGISLMTDTQTLVQEIKKHHRHRRFAMKSQQRIERSMESFVRLNYTDWSPDMDDKQKAKIKTLVASLIKRARKRDRKLDAEGLIELVTASDASRKVWDKIRKDHERAMERTAKKLPEYLWVKPIKGFGALGLAEIVALAIGENGGCLCDFHKPSNLWKRLGFAPYDGHAGSTWKRETWRPRKLSAEEWTDAPFDGEDYGIIITIANFLFAHQWIGKNKSEDGVGRPNGPYGEVYAERRVWTSGTHPEWSDGHAHKDAIRFMMKRVLKHLLHAAKRASIGSVDELEEAA